MTSLIAASIVCLPGVADEVCLRLSLANGLARTAGLALGAFRLQRLRDLCASKEDVTMWRLFRGNMVTCQQLVDLLSDYVDGELSPKRRRQLDAHLRGCVSCATFLKTFKQTMAMAQTIQYDDLPPELRQRLHRFLREQLSPDPPA